MGGNKRLMGRDAKLSGWDTNGEAKNFSEGGSIKFWLVGGIPPSPCE